MTFHIKSYIKHLYIIAFTAMIAASCTNDPAEGRSGGPDGSGSALVKLTIHTPSSSLPKATRNAAADECVVSGVKVIVLEQYGSTYRYSYDVDGLQVVQDTEDAQVSTFNAKLSSSESPIKLILVANSNDAFSTDIFTDDMDENTVKQLIVDSFSPNITGQLPMYGEAVLQELKADGTSNVSVTLLRAIARVDVNNQVDPLFSDDFTMEEVFIYRANNKMRVIPDATAMKTDNSFSVAKPTVPSGSSFYEAYSKISGSSQSVEKLYLPESAAPDASNHLLGATCVVVGGYYADDDFPSYYRIDFDSGLDGHPFGQVLRNHKYIFNIQQVHERGWLTPDDAANNESTSITAVMQVWDEMTSEMWFSCKDNYLGISTRKVELNYFKGSERTVYLQATQPFSIQQLDENGNPTGAVINSDGQSFTTGFYNLEIEKNNADGEDVYRLIITSTGENRTDESFTDKFKVFTDSWLFDVDVEQISYKAVYAKRIVKILTITTLPGDLGTTDGILSDISGGAMRRVLENKSNFSPAGTIPIGGIIVYDLLNSTVSSSAAEPMYILEKMLETVDVVHLPKDCTPSVAASRMIYDWLVASENHILILGRDNENTNANLTPYFIEDGVWRDGDNHITELGFMAEEENMPFFDGDFGVVDISNPMGFVNGGGYNNGYNWETTIPIIRVTGGTDIDLLMTHGVNPQLGVFYFGESEIFTSKGSAMSQNAYNTGTITSDFDILMGNIWSWIIERVVMESE